MTTWRDHLTNEEQARLLEIDVEKRDLVAERRRIFDRARKRADRLTGGEK